MLVSVLFSCSANQYESQRSSRVPTGHRGYSAHLKVRELTSSGGNITQEYLTCTKTTEFLIAESYL